MGEAPLCHTGKEYVAHILYIAARSGTSASWLKIRNHRSHSPSPLEARGTLESTSTFSHPSLY